MKTPKLKDGHLWEITRVGVKIWKKLPDVTGVVSHGIGPNDSMDHGKYTYDEEVISWRDDWGYRGGPRSFGSVATVRYTNCRQVVHEEEINWGNVEDPHETLKEVKKRWKRISAIEYGVKE